MVEEELKAEIAEAMEPEITLREMCFEIALAAVRCNNPKTFSLTDLLQDFVCGLNSAEYMIRKEEVAEEKVELTAETAIQEDYVVCLECGFQARQLTNKHMSTHNMTINEYKKKWGYKKGQKLVCLKTSRKRKKAAKKRGAPAGLMQYLENKKKAKETAASTPKKEVKKVETRRRRPAPKEAPVEQQTEE